jgi:hypothetical protein
MKLPKYPPAAVARKAAAFPMNTDSLMPKIVEINDVGMVKGRPSSPAASVTTKL